MRIWRKSGWTSAFDRQDGHYYHEAVRHYAETGQDERCAASLAGFLDWLDQLRDREQVWRLGELIGQIYAETGWLDRLAAKPDGASQIRRLQQFRQWAEQFERGRQRGLYAFARYLESLTSQGKVEDPIAGVTGQSGRRPDHDHPWQQRSGISDRLSGRHRISPAARKTARTAS